MKQPQPPERGNELRGIFQLLAQRAGAGVGPFTFRGGVPLGDLELHAQGQLQPELALRPRRCIRHGPERRQSAAGDRYRFLVGGEPGGILRGEQEVVGRPQRVSGRLEE